MEKAEENGRPAVWDAHEPGGQLRELTAGELCALFSNLSKGCEKQYLPAEAGWFSELAVFFGGRAEEADAGEWDLLKTCIAKDLGSYAKVSAAASAQADRGALRALVWSEKVTKILASLQSRYEKQGSTLVEGTGVFVCEICGFVYIGEQAPEICPVCKVQSTKITQVKRG